MHVSVGFDKEGYGGSGFETNVPWYYMRVVKANFEKRAKEEDQREVVVDTMVH